MGVELGAEVAEDGEGEGVTPAGIVKRKVSGARGESGPRCHVCMSGSVAHRRDFNATYDFLKTQGSDMRGTKLAEWRDYGIKNFAIL